MKGVLSFVIIGCVVALLTWHFFREYELSANLVKEGVEGQLVPVEFRSRQTLAKGAPIYRYIAHIDGVPCYIEVRGKLEIGYTYPIVYISAELEEIRRSEYIRQFSGFRFGNRKFSFWQFLAGEDYGVRRLTYAAVIILIICIIGCYLIRLKR